MASTIGSRFSAMRGDGGISRDGGGAGRKLATLAGLAAVLIFLLFLLPSMVSYINPGHVGIVIHRTGGGVDATPWEPGLHVRNPLTTGVEEYPIFMQTLVLTRGSTDGSSGNDEINVNSVEGQPVSLDVAMSFELNKTKVPTLYSTFRTDIGTIQHTYVKQSIRQALQ